MPMDERRWERIQAVFHGALALPAEERVPYVRSECAADPALEADVLAMLDEDARESILERGVGSVAHDVMDDATSFPVRIGRYRVTGVAGRGGMGTVYVGERDDLGSRAAIKVLRDATLSPMRRERFASEQRTLAGLEHPFIARLYDADLLPDGTPYFVMEYVDGVSLTEHVATHRLSVRERLALFRDVCAGVEYAHAAAILHRDLKPSNIMVRADGVVKLVDFGIAKPLDGLDAADHTRTGLRLMTPAYAAPEQLLGAAVGTYTDVYSLGVVLYELLTGRPPFDASAMTPGQLETAILERLPERASHAAQAGGAAAPHDAGGLSASAWTDLDVLCRTAMHREPERRYRTVDALARDVGRFLAGQPLEARGDSALYRLDRFLRRNARPAAAAVGVVAVLVGLGIYHAASLAAARDAALLESARAQHTQEFLLNLFQGGDATLGPTDSLRVVTLLDRGLDEARLIEDQPRLQADIYATLGGIFRQLGELARADSLLHMALEQRRALPGDARAEVAMSLVELGRLRADQAEVDEAERLIREGLQLRREAPPARPRDLAHAARALGEVLRDRGDYADAIVALEEAVRLHGHDATPGLARALVSLAGAHFYAGDYAVSDSLNRRVLDLYQRLHGPRHPRVGDVLINLGAIQFEEGRYAQAEARYREALDIKREFFGDDHHQIAANRTMLGRALVAQERYDDALIEIEPALRIRERVFGDMHPAVASTLNELGLVRLAAGDLRGAEASFQRMLEIYEAVYGGTHALSGIALSNLSNVYAETGELDRAEAVLERAVRQFTDALGADHSNTAMARIKLGRVMHEQERWAEAIPHLEEGYDLLSAQVDPGARFLQLARQYLADGYRLLGDVERAVRWDAELTAHAAPEARAR